MSTLSHLWDSIADRGREIVARRRGAARVRTIEHLCQDLLSERGEASGIALARELIGTYETLSEARKLDFFDLLESDFSPDVSAVLQAADAYRASQDPDTLLALIQAAEPPRQELLRRVNMAPRGTAAIVGMRRDLLRFARDHPRLRAVDADFRHLLQSWFNRGFLRLRRIDWHTPAAILEKLFEYEAVHEIQGWDDLRRRLAEDRRCFAFFHPALPDEPLIFVEVALLRELAPAIQPLLDSEGPTQDASQATTALFYSINNCQDGLRGISFGFFLIKQVVADLVTALPHVKTFATLSPVPGFCAWLHRVTRGPLADGSGAGLFDAEEIARLRTIEEPGWHLDEARAEPLKDPLLKACAHYLIKEKKGDEPLDPVARFHLGNGARIEQINWLADTSDKGLDQAAGLMVNYAYLPKRIEKNHEAYVSRGTIAATARVRALAK